MTQRSGVAQRRLMVASRLSALGLDLRPMQAAWVVLMNDYDMDTLLRSGWVLTALSSLTLVQCGGIAFTIGPDGGGGTGSSSGSSSGVEESGSSSGVGESGTSTSGTGSSGASSGAGGSGQASGSSGTDQSGATSGSSSGASTGSSSGSGTGSSSGGSGASSGTVSEPPGPCPTGEPPVGLLCSPNGLECEYGSNPDLGCNSLFECQKSVWTNANGPNGMTCPINSCPLTYDRITPGGHCDPAGSSCGYPAGTCSCGSEGPIEINIDGGFAGPTWHCMPATSVCPSPRPRLGTGCPSDGQFCNYGACVGGIAIQCTAGAWQEAFTACPG